MGYVYIILTLLFTVFGQLVLKWQIAQAGALPNSFPDKFRFLFAQFLNPWIVSAFASAFLASLAWMAAMTKFELSRAYPYMSMAFILVMAFSVIFLGEQLTIRKVIGTALVIGGLCVLTYSA